MKRRILWLVAAAVAFAAAGLSRGRVLTAREAFLPRHATDMRQAPPSVALVTVALGGFRGLLADLLWLRVTALQEEGRFVEIAQLSDWITKLEPAFWEVWAHHSWNMAYNISVMFPDGPDRWRWVENGVRILREQGLAFNPGAPRLYSELSWLFYHKIGGYSDPSGDYYLARLFGEIEADLPGGHLADVPGDVAERFAAARRMRVETMQEIESRRGAMDWRLPEAHALYWAEEGRRVCADKPDIAIERMTYLAMIASFLRGRVAYGAPNRSPVRGIRPDLAEAAWTAIRETAARFPGPENRLDEVAAYFMKRAAFFLYAYGEDEVAARFYDRLTTAGLELPAGLAAMAEEAADSGNMAGSDYWDQTIGMFFEAARLRLAGDEARADRLDKIARLFYMGVARRLVEMGLASPPEVEVLVAEGLRLAVEAAAPGAEPS